ncbi:HIT domain protein [Orientia tsutsugamushi str. UT76]|nr:HIT domain protein [Orientia tsutsugamushi str. UT76]
MVKQFKLDQSGFKLVTHNGKGGGQEIPHFHTHIISNQKIESN